MARLVFCTTQATDANATNRTISSKHAIRLNYYSKEQQMTVARSIGSQPLSPRKRTGQQGEQINCSDLI